jgi:hypothetical protein
MAIRVFISHSCKDAELVAPAPADAAAVGRGERLAYARKVRTLLKEKLDAAGFEVYLDIDRLEPGDEWRAKLHYWLETCDAAVVLLNPEAVASAWVRKEVDILMHRWSVASSFESSASNRLRIIPVFLGTFSDADIRAAGFGDLEVLNVQAARLMRPNTDEPAADELAELIVNKLAGLQSTTPNPGIQRWLNTVDAELKGVMTKSEAFLDAARTRAHVGDADWAPASTRIRVLAHHLLHCDLPTVKAALEELRPAFGTAEVYERFASLLLPLWVGESLARGLVDARATVDADRQRFAAVALNAGQFDTLRDYINRAWGYPPWGSRCINFVPRAGEGGEEEVSTAFFKAVAPLTRANPVTREIVKEFLKAKQKGNEKPFFAALAPDPETETPPSETLMSQLATDYPDVTFVVLAGTDFSAAPAAKAVRVQPPLAEGVENTAAATKGEILGLQ